MTPLEAPLEGTVLVEASAGTGKTHTITTLFVRLVLERGMSVREIVVVTFTEAATAELRSRIRRRLRETLVAIDEPGTACDPDLRALIARVPETELGTARARIATAISELDLAAISTIHAFCLRVLQERAFESGARFDLALLTDSTDLLREVGDDYWAGKMIPMAPDLFRLAAKAFSRESAQKLTAKVARCADLPRLPAEAPPDPETLRPRLVAAHARARTAWPGCREVLRELLTEHPSLSVNKTTGYTANNVDAWLAELDARFTAERISFGAEEALCKLTEGELQAATKKKKTPPSHPFFALASELYEVSTTAQSHLVLGLKHGAAKHCTEESARRKAQRSVHGFEDLLLACDRVLVAEPDGPLATSLRGQYKAALIDEFQDTDPVQYRIFRNTFNGHATMLVVGDPKQSIYAFRGADVFSYIAAARDASKSAYALGVNYRSDPSLVRAVNTIFDRAPSPAFLLDDIRFSSVQANEKKDRIAHAPGGAAFEILFHPRPPGVKSHTRGELDLPRLVAGEIARLLASDTRIDGERVRAGDVAILTRTNAQARETQHALRKLGIPTVLESDTTVFESDEAAELECVLRAVLEPTRGGLVKSALATTIVGLSAEAIVALETSESEWQRWSERLRVIQEVWATAGFVQAYRRLREDFAVDDRLLSWVDGERRLTNLTHLGELLHHAAQAERLGPTALVRWLNGARTSEWENAKLGNEASELRLESDARAVKLLTIHKSKGLEYPIVYCPFLWGLSAQEEKNALVFHDPARENRLTLHLEPDEAAKQIAFEENRAEMQRVLYVALTRAKHRCSIVWGAINLAHDCALAHTLHPDRTAEAMKTLSDEDYRSDLATLAKAAGSSIVVRDLADTPPPPYRAEHAAGELEARPYGRHVDSWWRMGSFSSLATRRGDTRHGTAHVATPEEAGRDRDEVVERGSGDARVEPEAPKAPVLLDSLPRGTKAGTMLHSVFEDHDFTSRDEPALHALVTKKLTDAGYSAEAFADLLVRGVNAIVDTPLDRTGLTLRSVPRARRIDELEFVLPVVHAPRAQITAPALARVFEEHRTDAVPASYAASVAKLGFLPLRGYLKGFIDLVFEHEGRFYVVDYKSNHLGPNREDYGPAGLRDAMAHSDYYLQYHLYATAVDRWLRARKPGYDYEAHFGGVFYLFARGMVPEHPPGTGVFADRPHRSMIAALSTVLSNG